MNIIASFLKKIYIIITKHLFCVKIIILLLKKNTMKIIIKSLNVEINDFLKKYIEKRFSSFERLLKGANKSRDTILKIRITKTTEHHKKDSRLYLVECSVNVAKKDVRIEQYSGNIKIGIDLIKDRLKSAISEEVDKMK